MEGITILHQWTMSISGGINMYIGFILGFFLALLCFYGTVMGFKEGQAITIPCLFFGVLFFITGIFCWIHRAPQYEERYLVTIEDTVSFNEFNERYRIISQEGEVFTVAEKKAED